MNKLLLALLGLILLSLLTVFGLWRLDTKSNILPKKLSAIMRQTIGYCIDGRQVYFKNHPFVISSNSACRVCVCSPEQGGVSCQYNKDIADCGQQ
jgi:hypothetical protein